MGYADKNRRNEADRKRYAEKKNQIEASKEENDPMDYDDIIIKPTQAERKEDRKEEPVSKYRFF